MPKVTIGDTEVFLPADRLPEFSYSLFDLTDPSKVRGARSTTFEIPATNAARQELGGVTLAEASPGPLPLRIGDGGVTIFGGTAVPTEWGDDVITVNAFGDNAGWFSAAKGTRIQDLDLGVSETINAAYQIASWTDEEQADVYPLIDYGGFADRTASFNVGVQKLRPGIRVHRILTEFFQSNGFTVKAVGTLRRHWKKLFLPNTGRIQMSDQYLAGNSATLTGSGALSMQEWYTLGFPPSPPPPFNAPQVLPPTPVTETDPGGNVSGTIYTAPLNQRMRVVIDGTITFISGLFPFGNDETFRLVVYFNNSDYQPLAQYEFTVSGPVYTFNLNDYIVWEGDILQGTSIGLGIYNTTGEKSAVANVTVKYEVVNVEYQEDVQLDIAGVAPKMSVGDLISGLCNILRLTVRTDDTTHEVTFSYYDEYAKSTVEGIDWRDRIDHGGLEKMQPQVPSVYNFAFKDDNNDQYLRDFKEAQDREYGSLRYEVGGKDGEQDVEVPFAATVQRMTFGNLVLPAMRKEGPYYQQDIYEWQPRILVLDGVEAGTWTFDSVVRTQYPRSYFVGGQGRDISLAFGEEVENGGAVPGTVARRWREYIRRITSPRLRARVRVFDDEFMGFSFDRPRLVHDGWHQRWMYVAEVKGKRFGEDSYTECELIPM